MANTESVKTHAGVAMPWLLYGTAWKKERTADLVVQAVRAGFRGIDTACQPRHYNEPAVGQALSQLLGEGVDRDSLYLQTKFTPLSGQDPLNIPYDPNESIEIQVAQSVETSLSNLQISRIDSLILHSPIAPHAQLMAAWGAMETSHAAGAARQLGISNCYSLDILKALFRDSREKPAVVQNRFYQDSGYDAAMREWCLDRGIVYQSFWTLTANAHVLSSAMFQAMVEKYGKTPAQVFFRYLNTSGIVPLTGTCSETHMREDLDVFDFDLSSEELVGLDRYFNQG